MRRTTNMLLKLLKLSLGLLFSLQLFASEYQIAPDKYVQLLPLKSSKINKSSSLQEKDFSESITYFPDLGMENVPVLDQGRYGTCVTFAVTAALDAILKKGDYISQQGSLELDLALGKDWWNGAYKPSDILDPLQKYGVVSKSNYPREYPKYQYKTTLLNYMKYVQFLPSEEVKKVQTVYSQSPLINSVKEAINRKHRVLVGFLVDTTISGAIPGYDVKILDKTFNGGLWACKQKEQADRCLKSDAGHEVVIIGYDDEQQLFRIRNSWGPSVGLQGDWFMTYRYFELMSIDITEIW